MNRDQVVELLQLIRAHDNRTVDEIAVQVWMQAAARGGWENNLAREAVFDHFTNTVGVWLMPGHITEHINRTRGNALRALSEERRQLMDEACYILQDMGYTPNEAHQYTRAIVTGQQPLKPLAPEQDEEFRARCAARAEVLAQPPRELTPWAIIRKLADKKAIEDAA
jgi:hypothetical protein